MKRFLAVLVAAMFLATAAYAAEEKKADEKKAEGKAKGEKTKGAKSKDGKATADTKGEKAKAKDGKSKDGKGKAKTRRKPRSKTASSLGSGRWPSPPSPSQRSSLLNHPSHQALDFRISSSRSGLQSQLARNHCREISSIPGVVQSLLFFYPRIW